MERNILELWNEDDTCTERDSDGRHIGYDKSRYTYKELRPERVRRWAVTSIAKFCFCCTAMILFCVLLNVPLYVRANVQLPKVAVIRWTIHSNKDTKIYIQPYHVTSIHEPKDVCPRNNRDKKNNLFLLIVVCSSTVNFERRKSIRKTWGNHQNYVESRKIFEAVQEKYKNYNYTYEFDDVEEEYVNKSLTLFGQLRNISGFGPYIHPRGFPNTPDLDKVISIFKKSKEFPKDDILVQESANTEVDFKLVFLLGLPFHANNNEIQDKIEDEVDKYGDIIQEDFIDSYYNLTLKSIMMLKWVTNNCNESVRYILKTDDDMYVNVPNLVQNLRNRSMVHDNTKGQEKEYMLIGDLRCGVRPVQYPGHKWYSPRYMYGGRVYPPYLMGPGYALSAPAANVLYYAALRTAYFHLEDVYITGMCSERASPLIAPRDEPGFLYNNDGVFDVCAVHAHLTTHRVSPANMRYVARRLLQHKYVARCERLRLTQVWKDRYAEAAIKEAVETDRKLG